MHLSSARALGLAIGSVTAVTALDVVVKDVVVVGGGASGAYAAFRLREDYGQDIVLIEKESALVCFTQFTSSNCFAYYLIRAAMWTPGPTPSLAGRMILAS